MADRWQVFDAQVGFQLAFMGSLTVPILATLPPATAMMPMLLTMVALTALSVGVMGLLGGLYRFRAGQQAGAHAKQPVVDLVPAQVLIALHEPSLRSMIERRAAAPSRAPPSLRHLIRLTALPYSSSAPPRWSDPDAPRRA